MHQVASQHIFTTSLQHKKTMKMKVKHWKWKKHPKSNTGKQTLKFAQPQNFLPKFFVVLAMRTTAMSPQSQIGGEPETLEPPWQELQVRWTQLLQEDEDAPPDILFQLNFNGRQPQWTQTLNFNLKSGLWQCKQTCHWTVSTSHKITTLTTVPLTI